MHTDVTADRDTAPGEFVISGLDAGYATHAAAEGEPLRLLSDGLFLERVLSPENIEAGQPIFFADGRFTTDVSGTIVGTAYEDAETSGEFARVIVRLGDF